MDWLSFIKNKSEINRLFICKICNSIFNIPVQAECGCRFCLNCFKKEVSTKKCPICGDSFTTDLCHNDKAIQRELNRTYVECNQCEWNGMFANFMEHFKESHRTLVCKYKAIGCNKLSKSEDEMKKHMKEDVDTHFDQLFKFVLNAMIVKKIDDTMKSSKRKIEEDKDSKNEIKKCKIHDEHELLISNMEKKISDFSKVLYTSFENFNNKVNTSHDGILLWKITDVNQKIVEAKSGTKTSIFSPPFYSHKNGYKMCARLFLNGDGMGRYTHLSLFFVLMKGEHDALLRWPFRQKVTFALIDQQQNETKSNVVDAFLPDPSSSSFDRPQNEMNKGAGLPLFQSLLGLLSKDHQYIKDDVMFIKISIDTNYLIDI